MTNNPEETTFGHNQGRPNDESKIEYSNSSPAEDRKTGSNKKSSQGNYTNLKVKTGGDQAYQRQLRTCEDFYKGLGMFIENNEETTKETLKHIEKAIDRNVLRDFQDEMSWHFDMFQREMNESISLLESQQNSFKSYMETLKLLMGVFGISTVVGVKAGGLWEQTQDIIDKSKADKILRSL